MDIGSLQQPDRIYEDGDLNSVNVAAALEDMASKNSTIGMIMVGSTDTAKADCLMLVVKGRESIEKTLWLMKEAINQGLIPDHDKPGTSDSGSTTVTE